MKCALLLTTCRVPGLSDANVARVAATERHLKACDDVFAVAGIGRASTNASIIGVFDLAARAGLANVGIVCTSSDVWCPSCSFFSWGTITDTPLSWKMRTRPGGTGTRAMRGFGF